MEIKEIPMPDKFPDTPNLSNYSDTLYRVISQQERESKKENKLCLNCHKLKADKYCEYHNQWNRCKGCRYAIAGEFLEGYCDNCRV